jgi:hypothetical protein
MVTEFLTALQRFIDWCNEPFLEWEFGFIAINDVPVLPYFALWLVDKDGNRR